MTELDWLMGEKIMTELDWLTGEKTMDMVYFVRSILSDRKMRLLICALGRNIPPPDDEFLHLIRQVEQSADQEQFNSILPFSPYGPYSVLERFSRECPPQGDICREILGNPFQMTPIQPECLVWNNGTVGNLALKIYDTQDYSSMPILADALEDAGCTEQSILRHLRGDGPHYRGCWAIDQILKKETDEFVVRLYDMFDGWMDLTGKLSSKEAFIQWLEYTKDGTEKTKFSDGDYFAIYPANTTMFYTPERRGR